MGKNLRDRKFPRRSNLYLRTVMLGDAWAIQLDSPSHCGGEKQGGAGGTCWFSWVPPQTIGFLTMVVPKGRGGHMEHDNG